MIDQPNQQSSGNWKPPLPEPPRSPPPKLPRSPQRPQSLHGPPKKVILSLEPSLSAPSISERDHNQPIRARVVFLVTVAITIGASLAFCATALGLALSFPGCEYLACGALVGLISLLVAGIVRWAGHPLSHTALLQGYLLVGVLCCLSCTVQLSLLLLLIALPPPPALHTAWAWVQFLGGAQVASLAVVLMVAGAGGAVMMLCGGERLAPYRDSAVHAYPARRPAHLRHLHLQQTNCQLLSPTVESRGNCQQVVHLIPEAPGTRAVHKDMVQGVRYQHSKWLVDGTPPCETDSTSASQAKPSNLITSNTDQYSRCLPK